jgi:GNAT superfamily N-acetyltransferase
LFEGEVSLSYVTRSVREGDEKQIHRLLRDVWGEWRSPDYLNWLYRENPEGYSVVRVAEHEDKVVAHFMAIPLMMKAEAEFAGYLGHEAVTLTQHRRKGIMKVLLSELIEETAAHGLYVGYGVTDVGKGFERLTQSTLGSRARGGQINEFLLITNLKRVLGRHNLSLRRKLVALGLGATLKARRLPSPASVAIHMTPGFDESFETLWKNVSSLSRSFIVKKSKTFLSWRYTRHPENEYLIWTATENDLPIGYVVGRLERVEDSYEGFVQDVFGDHQRRNAMAALVSTAVWHLAEQGADLVRCRLSEGHPCAPILEKVGFFSVVSAACLQFSVASQTTGVDQAFLIRKGNHMIAWGDYDLLC